MITYADIPLLLEDPDGRLGQWFDRWLPVDDLRLWPHTPPVRTHRLGGRHPNREQIELATIDWPAAPAMRINSLYWPTGASRWAYGLFLTTRTQLQAIYDVMAGVSSATEWPGADLALGDGRDDSDPLTATMWPLQPRRLGYCSDGDAEPWLLPLVDVRWHWQYKHSTELSIQLQVTDPQEPTTWVDFFMDLGEILGPNVLAEADIDEIDAAYLYPDKRELERQYTNAAVLLDAAAWSVGLRPVVERDGTLKLLNWITSASRGGNNPSIRESVAGGRLVDEESLDFPFVPEAVKTVFRRHSGVSVVPDAPPCSHSVTAEELESLWAVVPGSTHLVYSTAYAVYNNYYPWGYRPEPVNEDELIELSNRIAADYYLWQLEPYDVVLPGIEKWSPLGTDDYVLYHAGSRHPESGYQCQTRIVSLPVDVATTYNYSQFSICESVHEFTPLGDEGEICSFETRDPLHNGIGNIAAVYLRPWDPSERQYTEVDDIEEDDRVLFRVMDLQGFWECGRQVKGRARWKWTDTGPVAEVIDLGCDE